MLQFDSQNISKLQGSRKKKRKRKFQEMDNSERAAEGTVVELGRGRTSKQALTQNLPIFTAAKPTCPRGFGPPTILQTPHNNYPDVYHYGTMIPKPEEKKKKKKKHGMACIE